MSIDSASSIISIPEGSLFVAVNAFQICELNKQKFTIFKVYVKLGNQNWTLDRRYNEFDRLNNEIKKMDPDIRVKLPGKRLLGDNFSIDFINKRMRGLDEFIKNAISFTNVLKLPALWEFLNINESHIRALEEDCKSGSSKSNSKHNNNSLSNFMETRQNSNDDDDESDIDIINLGSTHNKLSEKGP